VPEPQIGELVRESCVGRVLGEPLAVAIVEAQPIPFPVRARGGRFALDYSDGISRLIRSITAPLGRA
jgi:hypothetical protein